MLERIPSSLSSSLGLWRIYFAQLEELSAVGSNGKQATALSLPARRKRLKRPLSPCSAPGEFGPEAACRKKGETFGRRCELFPMLHEAGPLGTKQLGHNNARKAATNCHAVAALCGLGHSALNLRAPIDYRATPR